MVYHPDYSVPLPEGHRFPMKKFRLLHSHLTQSLGLSRVSTHQPQKPPLNWIELVHDPNFVHDYLFGVLDHQTQRRIGLPWSDALMTRTMTAVGGTILTARLALEYGIGLNTAGGTHHAFPGYGSGFCIFNDLAIATRLLQQERRIKTALILDLDVHQGDGTAFIFSEDPSVYTCSIHCEKNFPGQKRNSDLDVGLKVGVEDSEYLSVLDETLQRVFNSFSPDLVLYNAGVDPHRDDLLGKMSLTNQGIFQRDLKVFQYCKAANIPVASVIGGGYGKDLMALIKRHGLLFHAAAHVYLNHLPSSSHNPSISLS